MKKIGILYGSSTGNTEIVADKIQARFGEENAEVLNIDAVDKEEVEQFQYLILGTSTWGLGDMQDDWDEFIDILLSCDLSKKKIALFGLGDQEVYAESFVDGMGKLYDKISKKATIVGAWAADEYRHVESIAVRKGKFVGLAIDWDNEEKQTDERVTKWTNELKKEFK